jgi:hypothetical protein
MTGLSSCFLFTETIVETSYDTIKLISVVFQDSRNLEWTLRKIGSLSNVRSEVQWENIWFSYMEH